MKIYFMRHGETEQNARGVVQGGGSNSKLTEKGQEKVMSTRKTINSLNIQRIYSGNLGRHLETAKLVNVNNVEHIIDSNLNEAQFGCFENVAIWKMYLKTFISSKFIGNVKNLSINRIMDSIASADKTNGVEDSKAILARVDKAMYRIVNDCKQDDIERILIVSSGMYLETLIEKYNPDVKFFRMKNCGIYLMDTDNNYKITTIRE